MNNFELWVNSYMYYANNEKDLSEINLELCEKFNLEKEQILLFFSGGLNIFNSLEPCKYFDKNVENEVYTNLLNMYKKDKSKFIVSWEKNQFRFFYAINSYYKIIEFYNEFDDIDFEEHLKVKSYYFPILTQILEFCLNHFYRALVSVEVDLDNNKRIVPKTLGPLKNELRKNYPLLSNIDIDFRNALSHGTLDEIDGSYIYEIVKILAKNKRSVVPNTIKLTDIKNLKNEYLDISSGAIVGLFKFLNNTDVTNMIDFDSLDMKIKFEYVKLLLSSENVRIKSFTEGKIGTTQLNINIEINENIIDTNKIRFLITLIMKVLKTSFPLYSRYLVSYTHPYSINGFISMSKENIDDLIDDDTNYSCDAELLFDIQKKDIDYRTYKLNTFPRVKTELWKLNNIKDNSNHINKRFQAKLIILDTDSSKEQIIKNIFQATSKLKVLENKRNPTDTTIYGKMDADIISLYVHFETHSRKELNHFSESFICEAQYYRTMQIQRYTHLPINTSKKTIKKWDIYWRNK